MVYRRGGQKGVSRPLLGGGSVSAGFGIQSNEGIRQGSGEAAVWRELAPSPDSITEGGLRLLKNIEV